MKKNQKKKCTPPKIFPIFSANGFKILSSRSNIVPIIALNNIPKQSKKPFPNNLNGIKIQSVKTQTRKTNNEKEDREDKEL